MDAPTIPVRIAVGDVVQVTHIEDMPGDQPDNVTVGTFTVTGITPKGLVTGSAVLGPVDPTKGWVIELVTKAPANLALPEQIAEIVAWTRTGEALQLMGKGENWQVVGDGRKVEPDMIQGWRQWDGWAAEADLYQEHLDQLEPAPPVELDAAAVEGTPDV